MSYKIEIDFGGGLSDRQKAAFDSARSRWSSVITQPESLVRLPDGRETDGVIIQAAGANIDGTGMILGQAGPELLRPDSDLPAFGSMEFDAADLAQMQEDNTLESVIFHEMGHVLGIGTVWSGKMLIAGRGTQNPRFQGQRAAGEFALLIGAAEPRLAPIENTGGPGTREGHWRDRVFGNEVMSSFISDAVNPLSRVTIASLADLGYTVDLSKADPYELPTALQLAIMGLGAHPDRMVKCSLCGGRTRPTTPRMLPDSAMIRPK
jgi:hypothetical protein